jgi:hypothetical protein
MIASTKIGVMAAAAYMPPRLIPSGRSQPSGLFPFAIAVLEGVAVVPVLRGTEEVVVPGDFTRSAGGVDIVDVVNVDELWNVFHGRVYSLKIDLKNGSSGPGIEGRFVGSGLKKSGPLGMEPGMVEEDIVCGLPTKGPTVSGRDIWSAEVGGFRS